MLMQNYQFLRPSTRLGAERPQLRAPYRNAPIVVAQAGSNGMTRGATRAGGTTTTQVSSPTMTFLPPTSSPSMLAPAETFEAMAKAGVAKTQAPAAKLLISGLLAGICIGYGACLACAVQGGLTSLATTAPGLFKLVGALVFPVGLTLVTMSGAELYTGNTAVMSMAKFEGMITLEGLLYNWFWSYVGNLVGGMAMALAVYATGTMAGNPVPIKIAVTKTTMPWATAFLRAVLCNWLVCMAVWNTFSAQSLPGKIMGLWPPIATFVAIGLEHSVANMFIIPMGILLGAKVSIGDFLLNNLLPVTLGNTFSGVVVVAGVMSMMYGTQRKARAAEAAAPAPGTASRTGGKPTLAQGQVAGTAAALATAGTGVNEMQREHNDAMAHAANDIMTEVILASTLN